MCDGAFEKENVKMSQDENDDDDEDDDNKRIELGPLIAAYWAR